MSSATSNTSLAFCSTRTMESPCSFSRRIVAITSATICGASPSDGSSMRSTRGFDINARAIASICCSPPESEPAICRSRSRSRGKSLATVSSVHSFGWPARGARAATARFSRTVRLLNTRRPWGTRATPWAAMTSGARPVSTAPWTTTWPRRGGRRPTVTFIVVDLPAPLRPSKPRSRPSRSESETPCSTSLSPYSASMSASTRASGAKVDLPGTGMGHDVGPRALNDDLTEMEDRDSLGEVEGHVHVVLDHDDRDVARDARHEAQDVAALGDGQAGEGLVEQQEPRSLGERHRDLDAPALAVGGLGEGPIGEMTEADRGERLAPAGDQRVLAPELDERIPAEPRQTEEGQGDVPEERLVREQRDDLVRARHAEVRAPAARHARDVAPEE